MPASSASAWSSIWQRAPETLYRFVPADSSDFLTGLLDQDENGESASSEQPQANGCLRKLQQFCNNCKHASQVMTSGMPDWWAHSFSKEYLASSFSNRQWLRISIPAVLATCVFFDASHGAHGSVTLAESLLLIAGIVATQVTPPHSFTVDTVLAVGCPIAFAIAAWDSIGSSPEDFCKLNLYNFASTILLLTLLFMCGVHMFFVSIQVLILLALSLLEGSCIAWSELFGCLVFIGLGIHLLRASAASHMADVGIKRLLDDGTDGFCILDLASSQIEDANTKMLDLLCPESCAGRFEEVLDLHDKDILCRFLRDGVQGHLGSILVTCRVQSATPKTFECKLTSYAKKGRFLHVCLHVVGEVRWGENFNGNSSEADAANIVGTEIAEPVAACQVAEVPVESWLPGQPPNVTYSDMGTFDLSASLYSVQVRRTSAGTQTDLRDVTPTPSGSHNSACTQTVGFDLQTDAPALTMTSSLNVLRNSVGAQTVGLALPPVAPATTAGFQRPKRRARNHRAPVNLETRKLVDRRFRETPPDTVRLIICEAIERINPRGKGCCKMHVRLHALMSTLLDTMAIACATTEVREDLWQCEVCQVLNECGTDDGFCQLCCNVTEHEAAAADPISERVSSCDGDESGTGHTNDDDGFAQQPDDSV